METKGTPQKLHGSPAEMAKEFLSLLKDRSIPLDSLKELIPANASFFSELSKLISLEINAGEMRYKDSISSINSILEVIKEPIRSQNISSDERQRYADALVKIAEMIRDMEMHHNDNEHWTKRMMICLGTFVLTTIVVASTISSTLKK